MNLDSVADELYRASPEEFVERRKARVAEARSAKDRELVKAITQLRRPTRSAWLVNLLARESPEDVAELLELGAALADAQQRASGPDLRRLSKQRHAALETLTRRAAELGAAHGHTATEATRQEVSQTLQAALADPSVAELLRAGRVVQAAAYGGFGPMDLFGAGLVSAPAGPAAGPDGEAEVGGSSAAAGEDADGEPEPPEPEDPARQQAEAVVQAADEALGTAREEAAAADEVAEQTTAQADELADRVEALRQQLQGAEEEESRARARARAARKAAQQSQQALAEAEQALAEARRRLSDLEDGGSDD